MSHLLYGCVAGLTRLEARRLSPCPFLRLLSSCSDGCADCERVGSAATVHWKQKQDQLKELAMHGKYCLSIVTPDSVMASVFWMHGVSIVSIHPGILSAL